MKQAGLTTVVVLVAGRPMIIDPILDVADAIVVAWLPGSEADGITDVLFGDVPPTGKLPHSWPRSMSQTTMASTSTPALAPAMITVRFWSTSVFGPCALGAA